MTERVGIVGDPVEHSLSPRMQNAALKTLGLDWRYEAIRVGVDEFEAKIGELAESGFVGLNVTIPHKERAFALCDSVSPKARAIGAVNTLSFKGRKILGENTDALGFAASLEAAGFETEGVDALVLGAGGTARAVVNTLLDRGVARLDIWNRTPQRARDLAERLSGSRKSTVVRVVDSPGSSLPDYQLLVNTTALGLAEGGRQLSALGLSDQDIQPPLLVADFVYTPGSTELVNAANASGARSIDGIELLIQQGAKSLELWSGMKAPLGIMREAVT